MKLNENRALMKTYKEKLELLRGSLDIDNKEERLREIEKLQVQEGFWENPTHAAKIQKEKSILQEVLRIYGDLKDLYDEFEILVEYAQNDDDQEAANESFTVLQKFLKNYEMANTKALLSEEMDGNNAIISINAGAGGTESCDWAAMLWRMLNRCASTKGFSVQVLDYQDGDGAGMKSGTMLIQGNYAYGLLKSEIGVHRLVRISPFDSNARRHTSFASVFVSPEVDDDIDIDIKDNDIKIDVFRAGGAGGQSVNTTDSAVRITHLPSGIVVTCQNERSQTQNKAQAMKVLRSRLYDFEMEKKQKKAGEIEAAKKDIGWGAQIRSYVLHPYKMVKDHRTDFSSSVAEKVLDGELDGFIDAYLRWMVQQKNEND
ncbi:MAG: peptide chain release factor 2 [Halobacteriovoraceae bacterium]|nr:peptide chain release factor 2 [Halobacteriovoraceae bacterium]